MENRQSEALNTASEIELAITCGFIGSVIGSAAQYSHLLMSAVSQLRTLHARVDELEAMLDAVGAGGVSAQRVTQGKDHIEQPLEMVAAQEPFGYFKAEPFGWRDCAETDEGAIALYEAPKPQADARDAELVAAVVYASTEAMNSSMESPSFDGSIILESHHAASLSLALDELEQHRAAIAAAKGMK